MVSPGLCTSQHLSSLLITEDNKSLPLKPIEFLPFATGILTNTIVFINWATMPAERRPSQSHMVFYNPLPRAREIQTAGTGDLVGWWTQRPFRF